MNIDEYRSYYEINPSANPTHRKLQAAEALAATLAIAEKAGITLAGNTFGTMVYVEDIASDVFEIKIFVEATETFESAEKILDCIWNEMLKRYAIHDGLEVEYVEEVKGFISPVYVIAFSAN